MKSSISFAQPKDAKRRADPRWKDIKEFGKSRQSMVNYIAGIGGYHSRDVDSAIAFNVKVRHADTSVGNLWKLLTSTKMDVGPASDLPPAHAALAKALFWRVFKEHEEHVFAWGLEEAYEDWRDSDAPYETFHGQRVEWKFGLYGRGGGHLCMESCEGISLRCQDDDLEQRLMEGDDGGDAHIPLDTIKKLFIICVQNTHALTHAAIDAEVEYRAAWRLWVSFCEDELRELIAEYENRQSLSADASAILAYMRGEAVVPDGGEAGMADAFIRICRLADLTIEGE